ncbi:hypothetical protein O181_093180 [Austropuccinia psidii MF-1]|uniref:Uncharacterized protein n=1 Tax=Austropuccinia psidii MF-1 TaxID=1389203 RepID=A0A9Q3J171_9BASI|nr:hypothetical protein [Austropuccinia psidii MF-1]
MGKQPPKKLEDSTFEDELPSIIYKPINKTEGTFQFLMDGNEKTNGNTLKTKRKRKKVRFSENHELSGEEIINLMEKYIKTIEERDKNLKGTYHINFLDRTFENKEEPS